MKLFRSITTMILMSISMVGMLAQEVIVTVAPMQQVLPPQVLLYIADPGKYFTLSLTNTTNEVQQVYLGIQLQQTMPASDLTISTPANRQPQQPFTIQPNSTYQLNTVEMKKLFDHIPSSEIQCPSSLFSDYASGSFGLLPEGIYNAKITAYKWKYPQYVNPVVASNPTGGTCSFTVCYKAQAPQFLMPMASALGEMDVAEVDVLNAQFTWTQPTIACGSSFSNYAYDFRVVELYDGQQPDVAMDRNPVVYQSTGLLSNMCVIPTNIITNKFLANKKYLAQVTARQKNASAMDYVMIENGGKSTYRLFKMKTSIPAEPEVEEKQPEQPKPQPEQEPEQEPTPQPEPEEEEEEDGPEFSVLWGNTSFNDSLYNEGLYNFRNPKITTPSYSDFGARKQFLHSDIAVSWDEVWHLGGEGLQPDTLKFDYEVQLFNGGSIINKEEVLKTTPIYNKVIKGTETLTDTIRWDAIGENINEKDYLVLRVKPICTNAIDSTVVFHHDSLNVIDFAIVESISKNYFQCSNMVDIDNETPTTATADDLTGQVVKLGEYELTIDEIKAGSQDDTWEGKGRVEWNPLGTKVMVCVKFENLKINTDNVVFAGEAKSYSNDKNSNNDIAEKLFSDWGIDNYLTNSSIPYADYISEEVKGKAKGLAEELDLSKYYEYVVVGQNVWNAIGSQNIDELYMPIALPESMTENSPVNIQISTMKFAATHATMDLIGEFVLPDCDVLQDQILVFGAPRLCISPDRILPESGTLALLADLTLTDPDSDFDCTFKAPKDPLKPVDGCYVSWHADEFEMLGIDVDMKIPGLKKEVNGVLTDENPVLNIKTSIAEWEDWMVDNVSIDPFQAEDLPGWTFTVENIVYDHSDYRNSAHMGKFPANYDKSKTTRAGDVLTWQGLYIKEISVKMPKSLEFGTSGDKRLKISANDMFFDDSGATLTIGADDVLSAKTGKAGGWAFSLDKVHASFVQNNFNDCGFSGKFEVPLLDGKMGYSCQIMKVNDIENAPAGNYAYIFKVQQVDQLKLDFFLSTATFNKDLTYMLVEAVPEKNELKTRVELLMTGDLSIGGEAMRAKMRNLNLSFDLPGIHFSKMRLANCPVWESQFDDIKELQKAKDNTKSILTLYKGKEFNIKNKFYFSTGQWSLASKEKKLGPFELSLDKFDMQYNNDLLELGIKGTVKLIEGIDLSASAGLTIQAKLSGVSNVAKDFDFSKIDFTYQNTRFDEASFNSSFAGMKLSGSLTASNDKKYGKGYKGKLEFVMPGDLFKAKAEGGYFELSDYRWGYFLASVGSSTGIQIPPIAITDISAGFYFNCIRKSATAVEPQKGIIGVVAGLGLAPSGGSKELFNGKFDMTVVYDKDYKGKNGKKGRLTTFMLTGDLKAVSGMINSKATIVYQEDDIDKYFALNITVDAKADGLGGVSTAVTTLSDKLSNMQKTLNSSMKNPVTGASGSLQGALSDKSDSQANKSTEAKTPEKPKVGQVSLALDLRVTMKEKGKKLSKVKWHLYLGEPDEDKRCKFTLVDFKSKIVSVNIGANAYLCLGNELPGNGELPPIPQKIRDFLDGSTKGSGVQSADISKANNARTQALKDFQAETYGGVMLGASAWGYIDIDLGLFYGNMGALAGFDVSLRNMGRNACMNLPGETGYKGWYAEGQLYAYLYAKFGIYINLGFWDKKIDIIDAGIGGVMRMGLVNPSYFTGEARVKLRLLAGLVDINRKFEFECGEPCDLFYGNALDNFKLFGDCSIGDTIKAKGWDKKNAINPKFYSLHTLNTEAPIKEHFRVLDETELNRLARDFNGDKDLLKAQASRTFVFDMNNVVTIYEYSRSNQNLNKYDRCFGFAFKGKGRFEHFIDMLQLNPNKYYRLRITGWAKEIEEGKEVNPLKWNEKKKKYENVPWTQTKDYFFCTGPTEALEDCPEDLQKYVAIAYPSYYNQLKSDKYLYAYTYDLRSPNIAFVSDISKQTFKKGKLKWRLYELKNGWTSIGEKDAYWLTTDSTCNLTINGGGFDTRPIKDKYYRLQLDYDISKTVTTTQQVWNASKRKYETKTVSKIVTETTNIAKWLTQACDGFYHTGYNNKGSSLPYEKPFVGIRLNSIKMKTKKPTLNPYGTSFYKKYMAADGVNPMRYQDPYTYITYMSNYGLVGGWALTNKKLKINATTAQSLIYRDRGGSYEGAYKKIYGSFDDYDKVKALSIYDGTQWKSDCQYPLRPQSDGKYSYFKGGRERAYAFKPADSDLNRASELIKDLYEVYYVVDKFDTKFRKELQDVFGDTDGASAGYADEVEDMMEAKTGVYITEYSSRNPDIRIEVPYYQTGILWGSHFENSSWKGKKDMTMWGSFDGITKDYSRPHEKRSEDILVGLIGNTPKRLFGAQKEIITGKDKNGKYVMVDKAKYIDFVPQWDNIQQIKVMYYRVNAYNHKKAEYTVSDRAYLNGGNRNSRYSYTISNPSKVLTSKTNTNGAYYNK